MNTAGVIYILTNPAFPQFVKIGYADDIDRRLKELNRSECIPFAFRVYATYEVSSRLSDLKLHSIIDRLNPNLRAIETFNGKQRVREFYAMSAEDAYLILEAIAEINGASDNLKLIDMTEKEIDEEVAAEEINEEHFDGRTGGAGHQNRSGEQRMNLAIAPDIYQFIRRNSRRNSMTYAQFIGAVMRWYQSLQGEKEEDLRPYILHSQTQGKKGQKSPRMNLAFEPEIHSYIQSKSNEWGLTYSQFICAVMRKKNEISI